jgi:hypothetical protein
MQQNILQRILHIGITEDLDSNRNNAAVVCCSLSLLGGINFMSVLFFKQFVIQFALTGHQEMIYGMAFGFPIFMIGMMLFMINSETKKMELKQQEILDILVQRDG